MEILQFEEQWEVLSAWWERGLHNRTIVCLDAHLDLQRVSETRIELLRQCTDSEQIKRLGKSHPLQPDAGTAYSIEDFLYPAFRLGLINRLIWVVPPHVDIGYSEALLERLQQADGVSFDELTGFERRGRVMHGRLLGLNIAVCRYTALEEAAPERGSLVDIDIDFFLSVPGDALWIDPREVFATLDSIVGDTELVTLSRSVSSGFMPVEHRFIADYLAALWAGREESAHYGRLYQAAAAPDRDEAATALLEELKTQPQCAATHFLYSRRAVDSKQAAYHARRAAELSDAYTADPLRDACGYPNRQMTLDYQTLDGLREAVDKAPDPGLLAAAVGLLYCACGRVQQAHRCYRIAGDELGEHPELALALAKAMIGHEIDHEQWEHVRALLHAALRDDKSCTQANVILGQLHLGAGAPIRALEHLETALARAPSWTAVVALLARAQEALGNARQGERLMRHYEQRRSTMRSLIHY